jgi:hypothetical protein
LMATKPVSVANSTLVQWWLNHFSVTIQQPYVYDAYRSLDGDQFFSITNKYGPLD